MWRMASIPIAGLTNRPENLLAVIVLRRSLRYNLAFWMKIEELESRMSAVADLEYTALRALTEAEQKLRRMDITLWLVAMNPQVHAAIKRSPLGKTLDTERMYFTLGDAVEAFDREGRKQ